MKTTLQQIELAGEVLDLTDFAQENTLLAESEAIKQAIAAGSGSGITLATEEEYSSFKDEMQTKINDILSKGL